MNLLNSMILTFLFLILLGINIYAQEPCRGKLIIETDKNSSLIFVNDTFGAAGRYESEFDDGVYVIKVSGGEKSWSGKIFTDTVIISDCSREKLNYNFSDNIYFETIPYDVSVFSDDSLLGHTPLFLSTDFNELTLSKPGYINKKINLSNVERFAPYRMDLISEEQARKEESFFKKDIFKFLVGGILVLGGTTAYFKIKADNKFNDYQRYGRKELLNETRRYDLISGITFTALQINFGVLIYYFLID